MNLGRHKYWSVEMTSCSECSAKQIVGAGLLPLSKLCVLMSGFVPNMCSASTENAVYLSSAVATSQTKMCANTLPTSSVHSSCEFVLRVIHIIEEPVTIAVVRPLCVS